jgi:hypothetical protein
MTFAVMMSVLAFAAPAVEVSTTEGSTIAGPLVAIDAANVTVEREGKPTPVPLASVLEVRLTASDGSPAAGQSGLELLVRDGGRLSCREVVLEDRVLVADTAVAGTLRFPLSSATALRFRPVDPAVAEAWKELAASSPDRDLLVVRNGDVLDRLDGTISSLDPQTLTFLVGDQRVPIDRSKPKLFGVVFGRSPGSPDEARVELRFRSGDRLPVSQVALQGDSLNVTTGDVEATVSLPDVEAIDFGRGKVRYLSDMEPRELEHTPYIGTAPLDSVFDVLVDRSAAGPEAPIRIDQQVFNRGVVIHSRTKATWRLGGKFQRFVAVAGIEQLVRPRGDLELVISADGKELHRSHVKGSDAPVPLDLDVAGARELTIFVDFAGDWDISDHLALGDARLIK